MGRDWKGSQTIMSNWRTWLSLLMTATTSGMIIFTISSYILCWLDRHNLLAHRIAYETGLLNLVNIGSWLRSSRSVNWEKFLMNIFLLYLESIDSCLWLKIHSFYSTFDRQKPVKFQFNILMNFARRHMLFEKHSDWLVLILLFLHLSDTYLV